MRPARLLSLAAAMLLLAGCVTPSSGASYTLSGTATPYPAPRTEIRPLVVAPVGARSPYDSPNLVYFENGYGPLVYADRFWSRPLPYQVRSLVTAYLASSGLFSQVHEGDSGAPGELVLSTTILRFDRILNKNYTPAVQVEVSYSLYNPAMDTVLLSGTYSEIQPVHGKTFEDTIQGLSHALGTTLRRFAADCAAR
ncbi:membrane integrity-associated transporter subunit PqiC [Phaeovibrio sulfidiphilus]|uniref:Membrane integrity-associated transporter subunit PqiC n=1 Tax=Phaeovibrio sulfidiphilus TaxID=1220600 RepID=A0A8J6YKT0_9PROT|nr:ABC-type transport auxiliary lipoprotein family protein [Phaeovibrio sulfidiphilus]MBE1236110.1 membrane integrity-associated transporter subunit PqiC [Phaeovibrio sulfidiphilus]